MINHITIAGSVFQGRGKDVETSYTGFCLESGEPAPTLKDFAIHGASTAIKAINQPRFRLENLKISNAGIGIDMRGNSGGARLIDLDCSARNQCLIIDGCLDSVWVDRCNFWPFGMDLKDFMLSWGISAGRCDGFNLSGCRFLNRGIRITDFVIGSIHSCGFDSWAKIHIKSDCLLDITGGYFSCANPNEQCIFMENGSVNIANVHFWTNVNPLWWSGGKLQVFNCTYGTSERYPLDGQWGF